MRNREHCLTSEDLSAFYIITKRYHDFTKKKLKEYDFSPSEVSTMLYLLENPDLDTAKKISDQHGLTQSLICRAVDSLTRQGYITVTNDEEDRRINHLSLHIQDEHLLNILQTLNQDFLDRLFQSIDPDQLLQFRSILHKAASNIR